MQRCVASARVFVMSVFAAVISFAAAAAPATGQSPADYDPRSAGELAVWLDASDSGTLFQDSAKSTPVASPGDSIAVWADKSGNGFDAHQDTDEWKPIFMSDPESARSYASFVRDRHGMWASGFEAMSGDTDWTIFLVVRVARFSPGTGDIVQSQYTNFAKGFEIKKGCEARAWCVRWNQGGIHNDLKTGYASSGNWEIWEVVGDNEQVQILVDGEVLATDKVDRLAVHGPATDIIGTPPLRDTRVKDPERPAADSPAVNWIGELLLFGDGKSREERSRIRNYLSAKWQIAVVP